MLPHISTRRRSGLDDEDPGVIGGTTDAIEASKALELAEDGDERRGVPAMDASGCVSDPRLAEHPPGSFRSPTVGPCHRRAGGIVGPAHDND